MTKSTILGYITDAKRAHLAWVREADHLINALPVNKEIIQLEATKCIFGKWLYSDGSKLRMIPAFNDTLDKIERHHNDLHNMYSEIHNIYFVRPKKRSLLAKIFTSNKVSMYDNEKSRIFFRNIQRSSEHLLHNINSLEKQVSGLNSLNLKTLHTSQRNAHQI